MNEVDSIIETVSIMQCNSKANYKLQPPKWWLVFPDRLRSNIEGWKMPEFSFKSRPTTYIKTQTLKIVNTTLKKGFQCKWSGRKSTTVLVLCKNVLKGLYANMLENTMWLQQSDKSSGALPKLKSFCTYPSTAAQHGNTKMEFCTKNSINLRYTIVLHKTEWDLQIYLHRKCK